MTSAPPPPAGWKQQIVVPTSQQQAQDVVLGYLRKTLQGLPAGTTLDATGYGATNTPPCKDDIANPPVSLTTIGDLKPPAGTDPNSLVAQTGEVWKGWGWYVFERDDFRKPNRFGYSPDGYALQIKAKAQAGFPPSLEGVSPCFPSDLAKDRSPFPTVITAE